VLFKVINKIFNKRFKKIKKIKKLKTWQKFKKNVKNAFLHLWFKLH